MATLNIVTVIITNWTAVNSRWADSMISITDKHDQTFCMSSIGIINGTEVFYMADTVVEEITHLVSEGLIDIVELKYVGELTMTRLYNDGNDDMKDALEAVLISCVDSGTFDVDAAMHINDTWNADTLGDMLISCVDSGTCTVEAAEACIGAVNEVLFEAGLDLLTVG